MPIDLQIIYKIALGDCLLLLSNRFFFYIAHFGSCFYYDSFKYNLLGMRLNILLIYCGHLIFKS